MLSNVRTFISISHRKKLLFLCANLIGYYAFAFDTLFRFRFNFGKEQDFSCPDFYSIENPSDLVKDISWAILKAQRYLLVNNVCRHQAFQAKVLCRFFRLPCKIYVGVRKNELGKTTAHAWTLVDGAFITGFCSPEEYLILNVFVNEN